MIDQVTIEKIFDAAEVVDVVGDFVSLKRRGTNYLGNCPFHNEKTPSFMVSPSKGIYKCFGCGKGGNPVNFVMEHEQLSYPEALKYLAQKYHIEVEEKEQTAEEIKHQNERESLLVVSEYAKNYFVKQLQTSDEGLAIGLSYFKERGFTAETLKTFELGYSPEKRDAFTNHALQGGYKLEYLVSSGITINNENYRADRFWARVMFPIHNMAGKVIAFGGRTLRNDKKTAKYLNSPETLIYHKSNVLYGIYQAKREIVQQDKCFLVEGYTDVLAMHQAGITNVVASSGTALTDNQIRLIKRFTNNLTILYDGDPAGIKASLRGIDMVLQQDINVKVLLLPEGEDPDSYSKAHSTEELKAFITANETDFIQFKAKLLLKDVNDSVQRAQAINEIVRSISKIDDEIKRQVFIKATHQLLDIDEQRLAFQVSNIKSVEREKEQKKLQNKQQNKPNGPVGPTDEPPDDLFAPEADFTRMDRVEHQIIYVLLKHANDPMPRQEDEPELAEGEVALKVGQQIIFDLEDDKIVLGYSSCRKVFEIYQVKAETGNFPEHGFFTRHEDAEIRNLAVELISSEKILSKFWERHTPFYQKEEISLAVGVPRIILEYKSLWLTEEWGKTQQKLKTASPEEVMPLMTHMQSLQKVKSLLAEKLGGRLIT